MWVFKVKCKVDGSVERYKTRLVAKRFTKTYGIDFQETFAPIAKINLSEFCCLLPLTLIGLFINRMLKMSFSMGNL